MTTYIACGSKKKRDRVAHGEETIGSFMHAPV